MATWRGQQPLCSTGTTSDDSDLKHFLSLLTHAKRSVRIESLSSLATRLSLTPTSVFASDSHVTLLFHCLQTIKNSTQKRPKASKIETCLSLKLLSLLAINLAAGGEVAHQVFDECLPVLSKAFLHFESSGSDSDIVLAILDSLSFVGFFGSTHPQETQSPMLLIWDSLTKNGDNWSDLVRIKAISAWSFLLSSMPGTHVSNKHWKSVAPSLLPLVCVDGVALAVVDALGLIFEMGFFNKFQGQVDEEGCCRDKIKNVITNKSWGLAYDENEDGDGRTIVMAKQVEDGLISSKVSEIIQLKFIRGFLGTQGFASYRKYNSNLQNLFRFPQRRSQEVYENDGDEYLKPEGGVTFRYYCPPDQRKEHRFDEILPFLSGRDKQVQKRMIKSPCSLVSKARSQLLKKQREIRTAVVSGAFIDY